MAGNEHNYHSLTQGETNGGVWEVLLKIFSSLPAAIQLSFGPASRTGNEATDGLSTVDIVIPVVININPPTTLLSADIVVAISVLGGSATGRSVIVLVVYYQCYSNIIKFIQLHICMSSTVALCCCL